MKKETLQNILYSPLYLWFKLHAMLPLRVLYALADLLYLPLYYIIRYRRKLVYANLRNSFPEKSEAEIKREAKQFYRHFCDYIVETIKVLHISDKEMRRRMVFENMEAANQAVAEGRSVMLLLGHYGNWEWIPSNTLWLTDKTSHFGQIYRPLKNGWFDRFFLRLRSRFGTRCIAKQETLREMIQMKRSGRTAVIGFMADQTPSPANIHHWVQFLSQETAVLTGFEKIARKTNFTVIYVDVEVVKRGYYKATLREITREPASMAEFEITDQYTALMEQTIRRAPWAWLWTHKRWKYKRNCQ